MKNLSRIVFGPVPSRRLGRSLGINNIPPKKCSYSCVYCQLGKTNNLTIERKSFYEPEKIFRQTKKKVNDVATRNESIDYLTFVADGEPTLDINLGKELSIFKETGIPTAVITNASLISKEDVKNDLLKADFVSFKIDAVNEDLWKFINRPHKDLNLETILKGITEFAKEFRGILCSETMLIKNMNYNGDYEKIANFLKHLIKLDKSYISIPTRPTTEKWVKSVKEEAINQVFQTFSEKLGTNRVECLMGYEGNAFAFTGDVVEDLLSITSVHPMRKEAVEQFLRKANSDWNIIKELLEENKLITLEHLGNVYYMRKLPDTT